MRFRPEHVREHVRPRLRDIFSAFRQRCGGCATTAMQRLAAKVGASPTWVYRVMNGHGRTAIHGHHLWNIDAEHSALPSWAKKAVARIVSAEQRLSGAVFARIPLKRLTRRRYEVV